MADVGGSLNMSLWAMSALEHLKGCRGESGTEEKVSVQTVAGRDLWLNSHSSFWIACQWGSLHSNVSYSFLSMLLLLFTGVDLWRHESVLWFFRPLLSADSNQWPWSLVFFGTIWDPGTGFPATLQLHCLEPLWHWHCPGHTQGARYNLTGLIIPTKALYTIYSDALNLVTKRNRLGDSNATVVCLS